MNQKPRQISLRIFVTRGEEDLSRADSAQSFAPQCSQTSTVKTFENFLHLLHTGMRLRAFFNMP
jgi:hypothetical protein